MTLQFSRAGRVALFAACALGGTTVFAQPRGIGVRFHELDVNRDGAVTRDEWRGSEREFRRYDANLDGSISREEFWAASRAEANAAEDRSRRDQGAQARPEQSNQSSRNPTSRPFQAGYDRGWQEGRRAGQEDSAHGHWDLDGQRELERADSGYRSELGALDEYQAGYREGFMTGYRNGFGSRAPQHGAPYRAGQTRGLADGREAGREDAARQHWDLEGQRELVLADAGYRPELGSRSDYQEGYRAGFHQGYAEGFGRR